MLDSNQVAYACGQRFGVYDFETRNVVFENAIESDAAYPVLAIPEKRYVIGTDISARMFQDNLH